jgi:hypothetical protein
MRPIHLRKGFAKILKARLPIASAIGIESLEMVAIRREAASERADSFVR